MKLKTLFVPLLMIVIVYMIIWLIVPTYFGSAGIKAAKNDLMVANAKIDDINKRGNNAAKLVSELSYNIDQQTVLRQYLPETKREDEIIKSLNTIAFSNGLLVSNISMHDVVAPVAEVASVDADLTTKIVPTGSLVKNLNVDILISGDYGKIRKFIMNLTALKRFNNLVSLEIARGTATDANANTLIAKMTVNFNYLNKISSITTVDNKIFEEDKFDMSVVDEIKKKGTNISTVEVGNLGRSNPFAL